MYGIIVISFFCSASHRAALVMANKGRNKTRNAILVKTIKKYYRRSSRLRLVVAPRDSPTGSAQNKYANFGHKISDGEIPLNSFADFSTEYTLLYFLPRAVLRREVRYIRALSHKERITLRLDDVPKTVWDDCNLPRQELSTRAREYILFL